MPKYQSRPRVITAVQFDPNKPLPLNVNTSGEGHWAVYNALHQSYINLKPGDYVRIDDPNDTYPIDEETFKATYDLITEGDDTNAH